jgi:hypothetical protein
VFITVNLPPHQQIRSILMLLNNHMIDQGQSFARSKEINKAGYIASILVYAKFSPHKLKTEKRTAKNIQISKRGRGYHPVVVLQIRSRTSMGGINATLSSTSFTSTAFTKISFSDDQ